MPKQPNLKITHLKPATKKWFDRIASEYQLESHHLRILLVAGEMWDRSAEAREAVQQAGVAVVDRYGQMKANPLIETERSCKILFLRSIRELGLDIEEPESPRPPTIQGRA